ncbi:hypothetical protein BH09ACT12_BH09ACT12_00200 [soil metagenome]
MAPTKHEHEHLRGGAGNDPNDPVAPADDSADHPVPAPDARVAAVLEVLGGAPFADVAATWAVDDALLRRWVSSFVEAGTAQVLNRPEAQALAQRERFLAAFALEIRTPLTVALGWAGLLAEGDLPSMSFIRTARRLQEALSLLADRLIDVELLVAAALGGLHVDRRAMTAERVCRMPDVGVIAGADIELDVDPALFARVLADLWDAAALAPLPRSRRVEVEVREPWVEVRIVREADPIDTDTLHALFEPFEHDQLATNVSIGLYLARALTVAHGGTLGIDQDDERAVLWVRVPLRPGPTEPNPAPDNGGSP